MRRPILFLLVLLNVQLLYAGIDLRTGNYYVAYTDIEFPGSKADITRSYNSTSSHTGLFGFGWGTVLETKLYALPDGSLILRWWGAGQGDYYEPAVVNRQGLYAMTNAVIASLIKKNKLDNNPVAIAEKKSYFLINNQERAAKYIELLEQKLVPVFTPSATAFTWTLDVNQVITWNGKSFSARSWDDRYQFNRLGQLTSIANGSYNMQFSYKGKHLSSLKVDDKYDCTIDTDSSGKISRLSFSDSNIHKVAVFKYDTQNNLVYSKDAGDNEYWFTYDLYHNLVRIDYQDRSFVQMDYDASNNRVIKFKDRNGSFQTYSYPYFYTEDGKINYEHYATHVKKFDSVGAQIFSQYKEFENRYKNDGSTYLHRMVERTDSSFHEVLYVPEVGNAWYRTNNNGKAWSQYDLKKRPTYLRINDSIFRCAFNGQDLPAFFTAIDSLKRDSTHYKYDYNSNGELVKVLKGKLAYIIYGSKSKTAIFVKRGSDELTIKFKNDLPFSIENKNLGFALIEDAAPVNRDTASTTNPAISPQQTPLQPQTQQNRSKLLMLYQEFAEVIEPRQIRHEWIWEKF